MIAEGAGYSSPGVRNAERLATLDMIELVALAARRNAAEDKPGPPVAAGRRQGGVRDLADRPKRMIRPNLILQVLCG
jgi:hypothetical protein